MGERGGEGERQVCQTKPRGQKVISANPSGTVTFMIQIFCITARILYWAGIYGIIAGILYW